MDTESNNNDSLGAESAVNKALLVEKVEIIDENGNVPAKKWEGVIKKGEVRNPNGRGKGRKNRTTVVKEILGLLSTKESGLTGLTETQELEYWMTLSIIMKAMEGDVNAYREIMNNAYKPHALEIEQRTTTPDLSHLSEDDLRRMIEGDEPKMLD